MSASAATLRVQNFLSLSVSHVALNPVITASLLYVLTKGPPQVRDQLFTRIAALRNPQRLATILKTLKGLLVLGLLGTLNRKLNKVALNSGRWMSQKSRWNLNREIAVVTGGCSGIGELIVRGLVQKGVTVAVLDIQQLPVSLQGKSNVHFFACDITDPSAVYSTADRIHTSVGCPSILVNNAGILQCRTILDTSDDWLRKIYDVNVISNFYTVKAFLPHMIKKNKGHVITVASTASFVGVGGMADYCSTKAAVLSFHEALNQELRLHYKAPNVLTTSVHPNWIRTPLLAPMVEELDAAGSPITEPQVVADAVVNQITSASSGQLFLPATMRNSSFIRAMPNWLQEGIRKTTSKAVLNSSKSPKT